MTGPERPSPALSAALRALAEADAGLGASPIVEARLREAVRATNADRRGRPSVTFLALAAALMLVISGAWRLVATHPPTGGQVVTREVATEFLPLMYADLPIADGYLVRLAVPRSALIAFGLASAQLSVAPTEMVEADVLVGLDGLARAVRFVHQVKGQE